MWTYSIAGSEDEMEKYSQFTPEEAKEGLGKIFDKMDINKDGHVDVQELTKWILQSFA